MKKIVRLGVFVGVFALSWLAMERPGYALRECSEMQGSFCNGSSTQVCYEDLGGEFYLYECSCINHAWDCGY